MFSLSRCLCKINASSANWIEIFSRKMFQIGKIFPKWNLSVLGVEYFVCGVGTHGRSYLWAITSSGLFFSLLAFLSQTIFQHFWGFSRNFQRGLGGLQGLVCSQIIKEHNLAREQNLEERWQNGTTTKWYFFTFRVFPFLALHCQLVVHCSEVDRREEKGWVMIHTRRPQPSS